MAAADDPLKGSKVEDTTGLSTALSPTSEGIDTSNHYKSLINDQNFMSSAYYSLKALGDNPNWDKPEELMDNFLTKKRYFDTNLLSTANIARKVTSDFSDEDKKDFAYALDRIEKMPSFYQTGGAPASSAIADYAGAAITDPTNLAAGLAAAFTVGAGGAAALSAKQAATFGIRTALKSELKSAFTGAGLKALAAEGVVSGAGSAVQDAIQQSTEQDIGLRDEYSIGRTVLAAGVGAVGAPAVGAATNIFGKAALRSVGKAGAESAKFLPDSVQDSLEDAGNWLSRNFKPMSGLDKGSVRIIERKGGEHSFLTELGQDLTKKISKTVAKDLDLDANAVLGGQTVTYRDVLNKAIEGDTQALSLLGKDSPSSLNVLNDFFNIGRAKSFAYGAESNLPPALKTILASDPNYVRDVPEAYARNKRTISFEDFMDKSPNVLNDMKTLVMSDPKRFRDDIPIFGDRDSIVTPFASGSAEERAFIDSKITDYIKDKYTATRMYKKESGVFTKQKNVDPVMRQIIGYNNDPTIRLAETINGQMDSAVRANMAHDLGKHAVDEGFGFDVGSLGLRKKATLAQKAAEASARMGGVRMVPLVKAIAKDGVSEEDKALIPFMMSNSIIPTNLKNIFVTEDYAKRLKTALGEDTQFLGSLFKRQDIIGATFRGAMGMQAFIKAGKTIASPLSHLRNMASAVGYTAASGNIGAAMPMIKRLVSNPKSFVAEYDAFRKLGLADSSIDVNQVLKRFSDLSGGDDKAMMAKILSNTTGGNTARRLYSNTDNLAKFAIWQNEKLRATDIFGGMSPAAQQAARDSYKNISGSKMFTDADVIAEIAAKKTTDIAPVYGRVSPILEKMRSIPIIGTFTAYPAERIRNSYQVLRIGTDELREGFATGNKAMVRAGSTRLAQWYATQGSLYTAAYALNQNVNGEDGNPLADFVRKHVAEWSQNAPIVVTKKDADGTIHYIDLGSINPDQYMADAVFPLIAKAANGEDVTEDLADTVKKAASNLLKPFADPSLLRSAASDFHAAVIGGDMRAAARLAKVMEPGYAKMARDYATNTGMLGSSKLGYQAEKALTPSRFGEVKDTEAGGDWMRNIGIMGAKEKKLDPKVTVGFALNAVNKEYRGGWNKFKTDIKATLADPASKFSNEDFVQQYKDNMDRNFERQSTIYKLTQDMQNDLGMSPQEIRKIFKSPSLSGVAPSDKELKGIMRGRFTPIEFAKNGNEWKNIHKDLKERTGGGDISAFREDIRSVKSDLLEVERKYRRANLNSRKAVEEDN